VKAYVTSIGEPTTELCLWSLERHGIETVLIQDKSSLANKLSMIYEQADDDFIRVDADVIVNRNIRRLPENKDIWWWQFHTYDWFKQDIAWGGVQYYKKETLPILRKHMGEAMHLERPESYLYRLKEFHDPRRCIGDPVIMGLNGYKQDDVARVKYVKTRRKQLDNYDFELSDRISAL